MKKFLICTLAFLLASCSACGAAPTPAPAGPPRAAARAAVDVAKDAWVTIVHACIDVAQATGKDDTRLQCAKYLVPAHGLIQAAADAVDANWSAGAACDLVQASVIMSDGLQHMALGQGVASDILPLVEDALKLAKDLAGDCHPPDAGME